MACVKQILEELGCCRSVLHVDGAKQLNLASRRTGYFCFVARVGTLYRLQCTLKFPHAKLSDRKNAIRHRIRAVLFDALFQKSSYPFQILFQRSVDSSNGVQNRSLALRRTSRRIANAKCNHGK